MNNATNNRILDLKVEIASLKAQEKQNKKSAKIQSTWVACKKRLPLPEMVRVIVWTNEDMLPGWYAVGKFYAFDGTWMYTEKNLIQGATHWMPKDWMYAKDWPAYGPGISNRLRYYWDSLVAGAAGMTKDLRPKGWGKNAQISKKVVYFKNDKTGEIRMGLPEHFPASKGFHKVVCNTAHEAEVWSDRLRQYNTSKENRVNEDRERIEGAARDEIRKHMHHVMSNSRNNINREFVRRYLEKMDKIPSRTVREEYLHSEGYEEGR